MDGRARLLPANALPKEAPGADTVAVSAGNGGLLSQLSENPFFTAVSGPPHACSTCMFYTR